ncbi:MAG: DNA repair protein RecO [Thermoleophilia bacterium]
MQYEAVRALVLGSRSLGEADRIVLLFTRELGRIDAVVKGVRRTKSKWGGRLEPFNVCDLIVVRGRGALYTVTAAQTVAMYPRLREDRQALAAAAVVCEAAAALFGEDEPHERVFNLLRNALKAIDQGARGPALQAPLLLGALLKLLGEAGYLPILDRCAACGGSGRAVAFSAARGGLVCQDCLADGVPVTSEVVTALLTAASQPLASLRELPPAAGVEEALRHVHNLYAYHTGQRLRSLRFARA